MKSSIHTILTVLSVVFISCVQKKLPEPENRNNNDPGYGYYKTIAELKSSMGTSGSKEIKEDIVISGTVIADDRSGNFYKQIIIDDGTAAMPILLDAYNLYNDFPVGRKIYIHCKGLYTNYYYKLPQLGYTPDKNGTVSPIPVLLWKKYIVKANLGNEIKPISVSITDAMKAKPELFNRLIMLTDAQISDTASATSYALSASLSSATNITLINCDSNTIALRTSGYCTFQSYKPPFGKGKLTAIYTVYNNTPQLVLRDTSDVQMKSLRCF
ncbi:MAG: DUF5689 domain-containing protein [Chitinophagaceae bacterium]|jgi:hypothetical protein